MAKLDTNDRSASTDDAAGEANVSPMAESAYLILDLGRGWRVAVAPMVGAPVPFWCWYRYVYFGRQFGHKGQAWQLRLLWFYLGRIKYAQQARHEARRPISTPSG